jgi:peptide/nickel transport system substrate-binding protein
MSGKKLKREEKNDKLLNGIIIIGMILNIVFFGYLISIYIPRGYYPIPPILPSRSLVIGFPNPPSALDPLNSTERRSRNTIEQVVETIFTYNLSELSLARVPHLAESYWWENATILHVKLREGILFHDFTPFDANTTKWNFDRLLYLTNCTGALPGTMYAAKSSSLYFFPDGVTPIINNVVSDGAYNVTFNLNDPFAPFLDLLCYVAGAMLSPTSTPEDDYISLIYGRIVGTGPFVYEYYVPNVEVRLSRFEYYWRGPAFFETVIMAFITDATTRNNAMLGHDIDWLEGVIPELISTFDANPTITAMKFTDSYGIPGLDYYYLGMNNVLIPTYWRKAISHALNYTYITEELMNGLAIRANSPVSPGYGDAYNASNQAANLDLIVARQTIVDNEPLASGFPVNDDPLDATWLAASLASFNYTYNIGNSFREDVYDALNAWLPAIGVSVVDDGVTWSAFLRKLFGDYDELGLFWIGWGPDYKDPFNMLDPLFNPASYADSGQVDDPKLNGMMALALITTDDVARNNIYKNIQWYMANRLYPHCFGYHGKVTTTHGADIHGIWYNAYGALRFYPVYRS